MKAWSLYVIKVQFHMPNCPQSYTWFFWRSTNAPCVKDKMFICQLSRKHLLNCWWLVPCFFTPLHHLWWLLQVTDWQHNNITNMNCLHVPRSKKNKHQRLCYTSTSPRNREEVIHVFSTFLSLSVSVCLCVCLSVCHPLSVRTSLICGWKLSFLSFRVSRYIFCLFMSVCEQNSSQTDASILMRFSVNQIFAYRRSSDHIDIDKNKWS